MLLAGVVAGVGFWADREVRGAIELKLRAEMQSALEANVTALEIWIQTQHRLAEGIVADPEVRQSALGLIEASRGVGTNRQVLARLGPQRTFELALQPRLRSAGYFSANLVTTNLLVIGDIGPGKMRLGSTSPEEHQSQLEELIETGRPLVVTPFKPKFAGPRGRLNREGMPPGPGGGFRGLDRPGRGEMPESRGLARPDGAGSTPPRMRSEGPPPEMGGPGGVGGRTNLMQGRPRGGMMMVAVPVRDDAGIVRGVLGMMFNPELEFSRILSVARQGTSGETYAFNDSGLMLSQSRFEERLKEIGLLDPREGVSSALTLELRDPGKALGAGSVTDTNRLGWALTPMVTKAVAGETGVSVTPVRDYRGVPVVGAWRWLPKQRFGVVTQMDAHEAFQPLRALRTVFLLLVGLLAVAALAAMLISYGTVVWRRKATEAELKLRNLGQYLLEEKIGEGGMGVVYRARHALLRRETAVKLLLPEKADGAAIERFENEVQLTCGLTHPNTIQIYDFGRTPDGVFYYAMELLRGLNLSDLVQRHGRQPEGRILHILMQTCDSLHEAHMAGLVHRDIKPANIFLCERGGYPDTVKVLDFGLVERVTAGVRRASPEVGPRRISGTPNYLAPEAIRNPEQSDPRSDLYALGAVAYYLATGEPVFPGESVTEILEAHLTERPTPPRARVVTDLSPQLEALILRCLEKDPSERPQSAMELRSALASCPRAGEWDMARRREWWAQVGGVAAPPQGSAGLAAGGQALEETLRVDLTQRWTPEEPRGSSTRS